MLWAACDAGVKLLPFLDERKWVAFMPGDAPLANLEETLVAGAEVVLVGGLISNSAHPCRFFILQWEWDVSQTKAGQLSKALQQCPNRAVG